jgi:hypothetical protein
LVKKHHTRKDGDHDPESVFFPFHYEIPSEHNNRTTADTEGATAPYSMQSSRFVYI